MDKVSNKSKNNNRTKQVITNTSVYNRDINLDEYLNRYYWYTVDHRNIHIKLIVKVVASKLPYGRVSLLVQPIPYESNYIQIPNKSFWVNEDKLEYIPNINSLNGE